ncbi:hypothetical protein ACIQCR_17100 [Streptomyces sp. NPDC093249]|uniref:hypothetical protein n=1 Tax=unclassified Streptomyces TaxID=2593676 RepID=UPI00344B9810
MTNTESLATSLDALALATDARKGPPCTVGMALATLDSETAASLHRALATITITSSAIATVLSQYGAPIASNTVARHRRRGQANGCRCAPSPESATAKRTTRTAVAPPPVVLVLGVAPNGQLHLL